MPDTWLGLGGVLVAAIGGVVAALIGRAKPKGEITSDAPPQGDTWVVSPDMYAWFQAKMAELNGRVNALEDAEREQRARGDRLERLLQKALLHIDRQDQRMTANGMDLVPMDPELTAARRD